MNGWVNIDVVKFFINTLYFQDNNFRSPMTPLLLRKPGILLQDVETPTCFFTVVGGRYVNVKTNMNGGVEFSM